ncbi:MAG: helix-turn-helix domain-containing protein [Oligoflexus sp.]|nr:helix-turn-helix domain-containing protein [Oligoflexus sp.]
MAHKNEEISAEEAAILLDLHPRTIRNLIQRREIKASKVKGRWYLDKASVMALKDKDTPLSEPREPAVTAQSLSLRGPVGHELFKTREDRSRSVFLPRDVRYAG